MPNNILVTGANGFIGSHLVNHLTKQADVNLVVAAIRDQRDDSWTYKSLFSAVKVFVDLNRPSALEKIKRILSHYHIDQIYHLASQPIVSRAIKNPLDTYQTNIMGTAKILEAARHIGDIDILYISTDKVYGEGQGASQDAPMNSSEPYSSSKICAEYIIRDYRREFNTNITVARPCNIIGYDPYNPSRLVPNTIIKLLGGEPPVIYNADSLRQWIYIEDVIMQLKEKIGTNNHFNIGSPFIKSPREVILTISNIMGSITDPIERSAGFSEIKKQSMIWDTSSVYTPFRDALKHTIKMFEDYYWGWMSK